MRVALAVALGVAFPLTWASLLFLLYIDICCDMMSMLCHLGVTCVLKVSLVTTNIAQLEAQRSHCAFDIDTSA